MTQDSFVDAGACSVSGGQARAEDSSTPNSSGTAPDIRQMPDCTTIEATEADEFVVLEFENREAVAVRRNSFYEGPSGD
jgi:hypothetical protein